MAYTVLFRRLVGTPGGAMPEGFIIAEHFVGADDLDTLSTSLKRWFENRVGGRSNPYHTWMPVAYAEGIKVAADIGDSHNQIRRKEVIHEWVHAGRAVATVNDGSGKLTFVPQVVDSYRAIPVVKRVPRIQQVKIPIETKFYPDPSHSHSHGELQVYGPSSQVTGGTTYSSALGHVFNELTKEAQPVNNTPTYAGLLMCSSEGTYRDHQIASEFGTVK